MKSDIMKSITNGKRIMVFIDAANVIFSMNNFDWRFDYKKLYSYFNNDYNLVEVNFYTSIRKENKKDEQWVNLLRRFGYNVKCRVLKIIRNKNNELIKKGNLDGHIFVDAVDRVNDYDVCILFSGDSDFEVLIKYLQNNNKKVIVFSSKKYCARELKECADMYLSLQFFRDIAGRKKAELFV